MADANLDMVLELLRRMQVDLREIKEDVRELTRRTGRIEQLMGGMVSAAADESVRLDRLNERVVRIERRLDLSDNNHGLPDPNLAR